MTNRPRTMLDISSLEQVVNTLQERIDHLQKSLTQQQKLATLGMVTSVIAHEFNNILTPMINYTRYAISDKNDEALRDKALAKALSGAERLAAISESLLGFARGDQSGIAHVHHSIQETLACLSRDLSKDGITLIVEVPTDLHVAMNAGQFQQVMMNLIVNARSAMIEHSARLRRLTVRASQIQRGKIAHIEICDTGPGIPKDVLPRIFDPFFSTKDRPEKHPVDISPDAVVRGGTGLGLTICQELVNAAGGSMRAESAEGKGATFILELPVAQAVAGEKAA